MVLTDFGLFVGLGFGLGGDLGFGLPWVGLPCCLCADLGVDMGLPWVGFAVGLGLPCLGSS